MVSQVVMYGCESWTIKKSECWRIDTFHLWCWKRLLRVPWRSNQSILKEISPEYSLEGLMLKLKLQSFGHLMRRADSLGKTWCWERLKVGGEGDGRGRDGWMASPSQWTWVWASSGRGWRTGRPGVLQPQGGSESDTTEWLTPTTQKQVGLSLCHTQCAKLNSNQSFSLNGMWGATAHLTETGEKPNSLD